VMMCVVVVQVCGFCMLFCIANVLNQEACVSASVHGITLHLLLTVQVCLLALCRSPVELNSGNLDLIEMQQGKWAGSSVQTDT